ncbi:hypothetical protein B484DRAFT_303978, partial [Ochromonadaceae sp. CCMP2298]
IETAPQNARRIFTGTDIAADVDSVWRVLTDYAQLQTVVPSLVANEVLEIRADGGARLRQVGGAKIFPGVTFKAKMTVDVAGGVPPPLRGHAAAPQVLRRDLPVPGDFDHYQGVWRMQELPGCSIGGQPVTRLTYAVELRPKGFLPVGLIEGRIAADLKANMVAI